MVGDWDRCFEWVEGTGEDEGLYLEKMRKGKKRTKDNFALLNEGVQAMTNDFDFFHVGI